MYSKGLCRDDLCTVQVYPIFQGILVEYSIVLTFKMPVTRHNEINDNQSNKSTALS